VFHSLKEGWRRRKREPLPYLEDAERSEPGGPLADKKNLDLLQGLIRTREPGNATVPAGEKGMPERGPEDVQEITVPLIFPPKEGGEGCRRGRHRSSTPNGQNSSAVRVSRKKRK